MLLHQQSSPLYTNQEAAHYLRVSKKWLQRNRKGKHPVKIRYLKIGRGIFYERSALKTAIRCFEQVSLSS